MLDRLESQIYSRVKNGFSKSIAEKYPNLNFTTSDQSSTKAKFPTVYIHFIDSPEIGETLESTSLNGTKAAFQIDVSDNENNNRTDEVAREVLRIMKSMGFRVLLMPIHNNDGNVYKTTARYRRTTLSGDTF